MSVKEKLVPLMQAVQKDKSLSNLPSLKEMSDLYKGEGQDDTSIHALQKLANGLRAKFSVTDKLSIDDMTKLFQQPATEEVLLWENKYFNATGNDSEAFRLNGDSRFLHPYKLKFKFHTVSSSSGKGFVAVGTDFISDDPQIEAEESFTVSSNGDQDHEIVLDIPKGEKSATCAKDFVVGVPDDCFVPTLAIYAIFPQEN